ncbi:hypothetical protein FACS1894103_1840 [Campylobacterota bacterium]|nr:hypothetical protein FACS1894103_1840 [Campylobacterota bacterium]
MRMNLTFDTIPQLWRVRGVVFMFITASFMLAASVSKLFLPTESVETSVVMPFNYSKTYPFERAFAIRNSRNAGAITQQGGTTAAGNATLTGLKIKAIYAEADKSGFVVIDDGQTLTFVSVGEAIRGYTLSQVESKRALFVRSGVNYELNLIETTPEARVSTGASASATDQPRETAQRKQEVTKEELKRYKTDSSLIWSNIGIAPVNERGRFKEFKVTFVKADSIFAELGLQAGDVLKSVNGIELNGYAAAMRLYSEIDKMDQFRLNIERNKQTKELIYEIR